MTSRSLLVAESGLRKTLYLFLLLVTNDRIQLILYRINYMDLIKSVISFTFWSIIYWVLASTTKRKTGSVFDGRKLNHQPEDRSEEHTSELQSQFHIVYRLLLEKNKPY